MNDLRNSKQDERMEEMLEMLESMEKELTQKDSIIQQRDSEIRTLQGQLNESLNLCEKLNSENKAENVQALKNELKQTKELLQSEKEKKKRADSTIEECQDKLRQAEREMEYALTHQKKVEIPVEKPVLYERCKICDRKAHVLAKERYEKKRGGLEKKFKARTMRFDAMHCVLWWYGIVTTIFAAVRSEVVEKDFLLFIRTIWSAICKFGNGAISAGQYAAQLGDKISNEVIAVIVYWLLQILIPAGAIAGTAFILIALVKKVAKVYKENFGDKISVMLAISNVAVVVYFGDLIKQVLEVNLVLVVLILEVLYVGIRTYVNGCRRAKGQY